MDKQQLLALIDRYLNGEATEVEQEFLLNYCNSFQSEDAWKEEKEGSKSEMLNQLFQQLQTETAYRAEAPPVHRVHFLKRFGWIAAASVALLVYLGNEWRHSKSVTVPAAETAANADVLPGKSGAILTLGDGSQVLLDSIQNGVVASQGGTTATLIDGRLTYGGKGEEVVYNTMSTPRGRQFHITLPDGTNAWLNAASSIRYPTKFSGNERMVAITGEVYFDVVKDQSKPFRVNVANIETIEVLGTTFNVNAYENEANIETTLLSGAVKIGDTRLKPSQQALLTKSHLTINNSQLPYPVKVINLGDPESAISWKKGIFNFDGMKLADVMKQLQRWYDIDVVYESGVPDIRFGGKMKMDMTLNSVLKALQKTELKFRIEGKSLIISQ